MSKKKDEMAVVEKKSNYAFLVAPAKDLVENFSIDVLKALTGYLEAIQRADQDADENPANVFKFFDFAEGSRILEGSARVYAKKVDHVFQLTLAVVDLLENKDSGDGSGRGGARGRGRRVANYGSTGYDLIDVKEVKREAMAGYEKALKEEKKAIDALRTVDNAEIAEAHYERKQCLVDKPTQFMFKLDYGQIQRADEQILNSKSRPDVIGKVKDFYIKKSDVLHEQHEVLVSHDDYKKNADQFTLPGARWIPDNKELAANFGVADIEVELDRDQEREQVNAYGPFKDPLTGREVVAPPRWFIEQEATRQNLEIQSRATSRAASKRALRDSQQLGSQASQRFSQRQSQPFIERHRQNLNDFVSFVENRMNKNRPSTHLNTGLVDLFVNNYGGNDSYSAPPQQPAEPDFDDDFGAGGGGANYDDENDENSNDYVRNLTRGRVPVRETAPYDDLEPVKIPMYLGDEDIPVTRKPLKVLTRIPPKPSTLLQRKQAREAKIPKTRRDEFMETHDYLQDFYYWRSAARINPNKDWKVEALRTAILAEKKRRCREKTRKIQEARAQNLNRRRQQQRSTRFAPEYDNNEDYGGVDEMADDDFDAPVIDNNRRTMGDKYDDVVDDDLHETVQEEEFRDINFEDDEPELLGEPGREAVPMADDFDAPPLSTDAPNAPNDAPYRPLMFEDIDDAELNNVINLPGKMFFDKALPLLKKFADNKTNRDQMAYEMAKAYEDVDVAVSTLQEQVDKWHQKMEPILDEGETRKEYDVNIVGQHVIDEYETEGETKRLIDLCLGRPWYEISRYFLSCLFMCNMGNVMVEDDQTLPLEDRVNSMRITLLHRKLHSEKMKELQLGDDAATAEKKND